MMRLSTFSTIFFFECADCVYGTYLKPRAADDDQSTPGLARLCLNARAHTLGIAEGRRWRRRRRTMMRSRGRGRRNRGGEEASPGRRNRGACWWWWHLTFIQSRTDFYLIALPICLTGGAEVARSRPTTSIKFRNTFQLVLAFIGNAVAAC